MATDYGYLFQQRTVNALLNFAILFTA